MINIEKDKKYQIFNIKNLEVGRQYSPKSSEFHLKFNKNGKNTSVERINVLREVCKIDRIKPYYEFFNNFSSCLNIKSDDNIRWDLILDKK